MFFENTPNVITVCFILKNSFNITQLYHVIAEPIVIQIYLDITDEKCSAWAFSIYSFFNQRLIPFFPRWTPTTFTSAATSTRMRCIYEK